MLHVFILLYALVKGERKRKEKLNSIYSFPLFRAPGFPFDWGVYRGGGNNGIQGAVTAVTPAPLSVQHCRMRPEGYFYSPQPPTISAIRRPYGYMVSTNERSRSLSSFNQLEASFAVTSYKLMSELPSRIHIVHIVARAHQRKEKLKIDFSYHLFFHPPSLFHL